MNFPGASTSLNRVGERRKDPDQEGRQRDAARRIEASLAYMMAHLDQPLQVSTLSAQSGLSVSHFFTVFRCATGSAPMDYFIRARMRRACELLRNTTLKVKEVAAALGYHDPFYFSRQFKVVNRVAPSNYRTKVTESNPANLLLPAVPVAKKLETNGNGHSTGNGTAVSHASLPNTARRFAAS